MPAVTREGNWGHGHTVLPKQLSPEAPSSVSCQMDEEGKQRTRAGPQPLIRFRINTLKVTLRTRPHTTAVTPSQPRSGVQKLAVGFVCCARAPPVCQQRQRSRPPARSDRRPARYYCSSLASAKSSGRQRAAAARNPCGSHLSWVAAPGKSGAPTRPLTEVTGKRRTAL